MNSELPVSNEHSIKKLKEAFAIFNRVSADLNDAYQNLQSKVASLKEELAASNSARIRELTEKERLAAKLSSLMEALPGGVIVLDGHGTITEMNPAALRITGQSFLGQRWGDVVGRIAAVDAFFDGEFSLHDGQRVSVISSSFGAEQERILLLTDITENHRLSQILNREKRLAALGEMAARLAHQVRTPLSSAILYLSNLSSQFTVGDRAACSKTVRNVQNQLRQIEKLVEGMLAYIKGDISACRRFSPVALLAEVRQATLPQITAANGTFATHYDGDDFEFRGDHEALFNALSNLVINAIQAVADRPQVTLSLLRESDFIEFRVADNGPGIDEAVRDRIFDPFFSTRSGGTGLGLAVVMSAVKAHQGDIKVDCPAHGGTVFTLTIPRQPTDFNELISREQEQAAGQRKPIDCAVV
jgi:two-component system sensor histidine kinase FlrB